MKRSQEKKENFKKQEMGELLGAIHGQDREGTRGQSCIQGDDYG